MSKYRILEKKGEYRNVCCGHGTGLGVLFCDSLIPTCNNRDKRHISRYIVQEWESSVPQGGYVHIPDHDSYKDLKEFTSLEEAREYKRDLELDEGIVRE